jgi:hypothetical protein
MDQADVEGLYDLYVDTLPDQPTVNADALAAHQELSEEQRIKDIDVTTVIDNSYVENAQLKD